MSAPVIWGIAAPEAGFVCVNTNREPIVVRPNAKGLVLAPISAAARNIYSDDSILSFLPDGRFIGTAGPPGSIQPGGVGRCRDAGAPGQRRPEPTRWSFRIEIPHELSNSGVGIFISTDTGYSPDGASLSVLAQGATIPLLLHPDTTTLGVAHEQDGGGLIWTELPLPHEVTDVLTGARRCAVWRPTLILRLDQALSPHLTVDADGTNC
jgi:hypothetical protein